MNAKTLKTAITAALLATATQLPAALHTLPMPPPSEFPDMERSLVVPISDWSEDGRRTDFTVSAQATPSNNFQVAVGKDLNGDEDLEPEEMQLVFGYDCGEWFVRDERPVARPNLVTEGWTEDNASSPTNAVWTIRLKQPQTESQRFDLAKVTVRGPDDAAAEITAEVYRRGQVLILR